MPEIARFPEQKPSSSYFVLSTTAMDTKIVTVNAR